MPGSSETVEKASAAKHLDKFVNQTSTSTSTSGSNSTSSSSSSINTYAVLPSHLGMETLIENLSDLQTGLGDPDTSSELTRDFHGGGDEDELDWDKFDIAQGLLDGGSSTSKQQERLQRLKWRAQQIWSPQRILLRDKLAFVLGSCMVWATAYWLGWDPASFYRYYTAQAVVLMAARYAFYRWKKWHYYMLDFCYIANCALLLHLWLLPQSELLSKITFAYNTGPLTWSTIAFRNSLVFHDLDKVTSVFLHLVPACVSWTLRWHPDGGFGPPGGPAAPPQARQAWQEATLLQLVLLPLLPYVVWAVSYYVKIFVVSAERIRQRGYITLFTYVTTTTKGVYAAIARRVPQQYRPQVYLLLHMCFCATTFFVSWLCWHSFYLHTVLLGVMGVISVWHGATFYFDVFSKRYLAEIQALAAAASVADNTPTAGGPAAAVGPQQGAMDGPRKRG